MWTAGVVRFGGRRAPLMTMLIACAAAFAVTTAVAAGSSTEAVKASYLFRFSSYVEWPAWRGGQAPFVFGVYGADEVAVHLQRLTTGVMVKGRPSEVRQVRRIADLDGVQILYVGPRVFKGSRALRAAAASRELLLVTDHPEGIEGGGVINFLETQPQVRFEVSLRAAERNGLKIDSALLAVAAQVDPGPGQKQD